MSILLIWLEMKLVESSSRTDVVRTGGDTGNLLLDQRFMCVTGMLTFVKIRA